MYKYLYIAILSGFITMGINNVSAASIEFESAGHAANNVPAELEFEDSDSSPICTNSGDLTSSGAPKCKNPQCPGAKNAQECGQKLQQACKGKKKGTLVCGTFKTPAGASCALWRECQGDEKHILDEIELLYY